MSKITTTATFNVDANDITIEGLSEDVIIDCSQDVDFTNLVSLLTKTIDNSSEIDFSFVSLQLSGQTA